MKNQVGKIKFNELDFMLGFILKLIFAGHKGSKNQFRNKQRIQFFELDFSKLIFQKSSTDQQEGQTENQRIVFAELHVAQTECRIRDHSNIT